MPLIAASAAGPTGELLIGPEGGFAERELARCCR